jgi:hypothetical protein
MVIRSMKPEITNIFGAALQQEVSTLLENLGGMTEIIEANFSQIKDILQANKKCHQGYLKREGRSHQSYHSREEQ